ncbi:MAG: EamA family transporter [Saprospiraceae bacterium]
METEGKVGREWKIILAFASVYIIWGSTYLGIFYAIQSIPPMVMGGMRFIIVGILLMMYTSWIQKEPYSWELWKFGLVSGFLLFLIGGGAVILAERHLPSGLVSIISSVVPFMMLILDFKSGYGRFKNQWTWMGLVFGLLGVVTLFYDKIIPLDGEVGEWTSYIILLVGTIGWTTGTLYSKYTSIRASTNAKASVQTFTASILFFIVAIPLGEYETLDFSSVTQTSWIALLYLITFGSLVGYFSYLWLLSKVSAHSVSTHAFVNPMVAVFLGTIFAGESFYVREYVALVFVILGLMAIYISKNKK